MIGRRPWTKDEEDQALALESEGFTHAEIALELDRTRRAVGSKLHKLREGAALPRRRKLSPDRQRLREAQFAATTQLDHPEPANGGERVW